MAASTYASHVTQNLVLLTVAVIDVGLFTFPIHHADNIYVAETTTLNHLHVWSKGPELMTGPVLGRCLTPNELV